LTLIGVVKSWAFISVFAAFATASDTFGWQCPSVVTYMPLEKSM